MDARISGVNPNVVMVESTPRPTPAPARVSFGDVLAAGAASLVNGAEVAMSRLPGSPVTATAVRGGAPGGPMSVMNAPEGPGAGVGMGGGGLVMGAGVGAVGGVGPVGSGIGVNVGGVNVGVGTAGADPTGGIEGALQQSAQLNLYYLQIQQVEDAQNRAFTAESNILKTEHDTAKNAIGNIHS